MNRYYRYELLFCGEPQGIGFIVGLQDTGIPEEMVDELIQAFDEKLPIPNTKEWNYNKAVEYPASYFTEKGRELFHPTIQKIIDCIESLENEWEVIEEVIESAEPIYSDDLQIMVLKTYEKR